MGHLNGILARVGGNLNNNFQKSQMPRGLPGGLPGGMLKLRFDRYIIWRCEAGKFYLLPLTKYLKYKKAGRMRNVSVQERI